MDLRLRRDPPGQGLGKALTETLARELPPGTVLEGTVVAGQARGDVPRLGV